MLFSEVPERPYVLCIILIVLSKLAFSNAITLLYTCEKPAPRYPNVFSEKVAIYFQGGGTRRVIVVADVAYRARRCASQQTFCKQQLVVLLNL